MTASFPTAKKTFTRPQATNTCDQSGVELDTVLNAIHDEVEAIETKVGVDSSAVTTSHDYKLSGVTGSDKAVSKTGTETLTNKTLTSPVVNSPTGIVKGDIGLGNVDNTSDATKNSASATLTNKTLTTPVINGAFTGTATPPLTFYGTNFNAPEGFLINGKIVPSVASNNLTVAIKGMDGNDPSATNPVYVRIGSVVRSITGALSVVLNAGTNWFNAGSSELATKEVDYFVYLFYYAAGGTVDIGFARIPYATVAASINWGSATSEVHLRSTNAPGGATDILVNIGRFAATLSAGAGYTWSVPTFTATNLIQRPIYETRWSTWLPTYTGSGSMTFESVSSVNARYKIVDRTTLLQLRATGTTGGSANYTLGFTLPISFQSASADVLSGGCFVYDGNYLAGIFSNNNASTILVRNYNTAVWGIGASRSFCVDMLYEI